MYQHYHYHINMIINKRLDIQMIQGDFLKMRTKDWRDADIVFTNSTCYDEVLMNKISNLACNLFQIYIK